MTLKKFRYMDMLALCTLALISEALSEFLITTLNFKVGFFLSFASLIAVIATIRWGVLGTLTYIIAGVPMIFINNMDIGPGILYYVMANAFIGLPILFYWKRDRDKLVNKKWKVLLYNFLCVACLSVGKGVAIFIIDGKLTGILEFFGSILLALVINVIMSLIFISRKTDLICDMRGYLKRQAELQEEE